MSDSDVFDRLFAALRQSDVRLPSPSSPEALADIAAAVAPLTIPEDLQRLWQRADPTTMPVELWPDLASLDFVLDVWRDDRTHVLHKPGVLLPFCYSSHCFLSVELHDHDGLGGGIWYHDTDSEFSLRFPSVAAWVDLLATTIELGEYERLTLDTGAPLLYVDSDRWDDAAAVRLAASLPHPTYGWDVVFADHVTAWPEHWRRASGMSLADRQALSATTTIAALTRDAEHGEVRGRIRGRVTGSAGRPDGMRLTVDDGTASLVVWCPASPRMFYLGEAAALFELDVVITGPAPASAPGPAYHDVLRAAHAHDMTAAQEAAHSLHQELFGRGFNAIAEAVRPVE